MLSVNGGGGGLALLIQCMVIKWNGGPHRAACSEHTEPVSLLPSGLVDPHPPIYERAVI